MSVGVLFEVGREFFRGLSILDRVPKRGVESISRRFFSKSRRYCAAGNLHFHRGLPGAGKGGKRPLRIML